MIPKKSDWPFHGLLVQLAAGIDKVPESHRTLAAAKTVERCFRLGMKLAVHYGVSPALVLDRALTMLREKGGEEYGAVMTTAFDLYAAKRVEEYKASVAGAAADKGSEPAPVPGTVLPAGLFPGKGGDA